jgi:hypothetical protein
VTHDPYVSQWGQRVVMLEDGMIKHDKML